MSTAREDAIAFVVFSKKNRIASYGYRIWSSATSFYIKHRDVNLGVKISIHGPDPRHGEPGFKFGIDGSPALLHETSAWRFEEDANLGWFPGRREKEGITHLARIRFPWSTFEPGSPSGSQPTTSSRVGRHLLIQAPDPFYAADIDLYLSNTSKPYWPNEEQARIDKVTMGPLKNEAGQYLTAVSCRNLLWHDPGTEEAVKLTRDYAGPKMRTIAACRDESGFLWIREVVIPKAALRQYNEDELREVAAIPPRR